jgi:hypothetical protein
VILVCAAVSVLSAAPAAGQYRPDTLRYVVLTQGIKAGYLQVTRERLGELRVHFEFNDRGRGPNLEEVTEAGADYLPTRTVIEGNDYLKAPVKETYARVGSRGGWESSEERGSEILSGPFPFVYVPRDGTPEDLAVLARALLASPKQRVRLLPAGEAQIERVSGRTLQAGSSRKEVAQYAITGLGFSPTTIWLETNYTFFAQADGWSAVVREGWESVLPGLVAAQDSAGVARSATLARSLMSRPAGAIVFRGAAMFDAPEARLVPGTTVVVLGNRITAVGPDSTIAVPAGAKVIDARGKTLLPGLWDMHAHLGDVDGLLDIAAGVTSIRDLANDTDYLLAHRKAFDAGTAIGPRIVMAGFMDGPGPFHGPTKVLVSTPEEATRAIDTYADLGYEQIKIYSSIKPELVPVIAEHAHARGLRLSGHIPSGMIAAQAVREGFDEIQHTNMLFLNFLGDTLDTRTPQRFIAVGQHGLDLDIRSDSVRSFLALLKEYRTVVDPTLATFEGMFTGRPGRMSDGDARIAARMPAQVRRGMLGGGLPAPGELDSRYRASFAKMLEMVKALYDAGIPLVAGTDCPAGFCLHRELELYAQAGIPAPEVLRIATWGAATVTKRTDRLGAIRPGFLADVILVDGNPAADIGAIRRVSLVLKDGALIDPAAVYPTLGVLPWQEVP